MDSTELRRFVYDRILATGLPPSSADIGAHFGTDAATARARLADLRIGKTILVHPVSGEIWMAGPFAAAPSPYLVMRGTTRWWANCGWDMLGVAVLVGEPVTIETRCHDCGEGMTFHIESERDSIQQIDASTDDAPVVHFLVPANRWYDDIGFT